MFYDVEKDTRPEIAPTGSPYGIFPRRFLRLTLYRLSVEDALRFSAECCETERGEYGARVFRPGCQYKYGLIFDRFTECVGLGMRRIGSTELRFSVSDMLDEPFTLPGVPRNYYKRSILAEYERIAALTVPEGYVEQCEALAAGVPLEYVFPDY